MRASSSPAAMRLAISNSSSAESSGTLPISLRYMRTGSSVAMPSGTEKILRLGGKLLRLGLLHRKLLLRGLLCLARHIYAHFLEAVQYVFIRFGRNLQIGQCFLDFFLCQRAVFLSLFDQRGDARLLVVNGGHRGHSFRSNRSPPRVSPARARDLQKPLYPKTAEILAALFSFFGGFTHPPCFSRSLLSSSLV